MALPMDEQRILEEMERALAAEDPRLAARLSSFGQPPFAELLRSGRARAVASVMALALIAAVAGFLYVVSVFRVGGTAPVSRNSPQVTATRPVSTVTTGSARFASAPPRPLRGFTP